jgi:galactose-1-phosphate uridylyltransferase
METITARLIDPDGNPIARPIQVRTHPITGRKCRITFARKDEKETGTETLPAPPPDADNDQNCPFCRPQLDRKTPQFAGHRVPGGRLVKGKSVLFPNLFPYGRYSGVSLFDDHHFVEIGTADHDSYVNSFLNCRQYLIDILSRDPEARFMAITQNHLPSAGGSLIHPHLQVYADRIAGNHHRYLQARTDQYFDRTGGRYLFSDYLGHEKKVGERYVGRTGRWEWVAAFAPEGFYELWGILPGVLSLIDLSDSDWHDLVTGILNTQRFYRHLNRNGYNLGLLFIEERNSRLEMRVVLVVRSNYAPWVRNDHTGYEVMLGDMATFTAPEETAQMARQFWLDAGVAKTR